MKALRSLFLAILILFVTPLPVVIRAASNLNVAAAPSLQCAIEATVRYIASDKNSITFKIPYSSTYSKATVAYSVSASTSLPTHVVSHFSKQGKAPLYKGSHYLMQEDSEQESFTFSPKNINLVTINAAINGVSCKAKTVQPLRLPPNLRGILRPSIPSAPLVVNIPACRLHGEGGLSSDGKIMLGVLIDYRGMTKGDQSYMVSGYPETMPDAVQTFQGTHTVDADGSGTIMAQGERGFIFTFKPSISGEKFFIKGAVGTVKCPDIQFAAPTVGAPADNAEGDGDNEDTAGSLAGDSAAQINQEYSATDRDADGAKPNDSTENQVEEDAQEQSASNYLLFGLLGLAVLAAGAYGAYRLGVAKHM